MATSGYNRYRGRSGGHKGLLVAVLVLILLAAVGFLVSQRYLVYDESGKPHWELPFIHREESTPSQPDSNPISPEDVVIDREDPEPEPEPEPDPTPARRRLTELHARELENGALWWNTDYVLSEVEGDMMVEVKRPGGGITYGTEVKTPSGVVVERGVTRGNLTTLLKSDHYSVARISCFRDTSYAEGKPDTALKAAWGDLWYDADGYAWLDPANEEVRAYLTALCRECAELGFDEILLDNFCYPVRGDRESLVLADGLDKTAVLADFAAAIREVLPENVTLSVAFRGSMGSLGGYSGMKADLLASFDRIYVNESVDRAALEAALPEDYDRVGGLALLCYAKPSSGGYAILP